MPMVPHLGQRPARVRALHAQPQDGTSSRSSCRCSARRRPGAARRSRSSSSSCSRSSGCPTRLPADYVRRRSRAVTTALARAPSSCWSAPSATPACALAGVTADLLDRPDALRGLDAARPAGAHGRLPGRVHRGAGGAVRADPAPPGRGSLVLAAQGLRPAGPVPTRAPGAGWSAAGPGHRCSSPPRPWRSPSTAGTWARRPAPDPDPGPAGAPPVPGRAPVVAESDRGIRLQGLPGTLSTVPKDSPASKVAPSSGNSTKTTSPSSSWA